MQGPGSLRPAKLDLLGAKSPGASGPVPCGPAPWQPAPHPMLRDLPPRLFILFSSIYGLVRKPNPRKQAVYLFFFSSQHCVFSLLHIRRIKSNIFSNPALSKARPGVSRRFGEIWKRPDALQWSACSPHPAGALPTTSAHTEPDGKI